MTKMKCFILPALFALCFFTIPAGAQDSPSIEPSLKSKNEKSEKDTKTPPLKINKQNIPVVQELSELLMPSPTVLEQRKLPPAPPYLKVINSNNDDRSTIIYQCRNTKAASLVDALEAIVSTTGTVEDAVEQNLIVINDSKAKTEELKSAVLALDVKSPQVLVEGKIVEVILEKGADRDFKLTYQKFDKDLGTLSTVGMNVEAPEPVIAQTANNIIGGGADFFPYKSGRLGEDWGKLNIAIKWLLTARDTKILSSPNLIVNIGTTASIITGQDIPIQSSQFVSGAINTSIEFKRVGVKLNVTPQLIDGNTVYLQVNPEVSQVIRYETFKQGDTTIQNPVIAIRNIETELTMHDGEIVMLGGLYSTRVTNSTEAPPILGDIPYIGELLTGKSYDKEQVQLIFFLKTTILQNTSGTALYDLGKQAEEMRKIGDIIKKSPQIFPDNNQSAVEKMSENLLGEPNE